MDVHYRTRPGHLPRRIRMLLTLSALGLGALLVLHCAATVLYVAPFNPLKLAWGRQLNAYMLPLFEQNWSLFAPDPINEDRGLLVRARLRDDSGAVRTTEYVDITTPAVEAVHARRLLPSRRARLTTNTVQMLTWQDPVTMKLREKRQQADAAEPSDGELTAEERGVQERGRRLLAALASAEAAQRWGDDVEAVQVRIVFHRYPRFSQRQELDKVGEITYADIEWMPRTEVDL